MSGAILLDRDGDGIATLCSGAPQWLSVKRRTADRCRLRFIDRGRPEVGDAALP
jgi:hypothetical protein